VPNANVSKALKKEDKCVVRARSLEKRHPPARHRFLFSIMDETSAERKKQKPDVPIMQAPVNQLPAELSPSLALENITNPKLDKIIHNPYARPYYAETYPYKLVREFLAMNSASEENGHYRDHLEFSFIFLNREEGMYWKRYMAFETEEQFKTYIAKGEPLRIEIGGYGFSTPCFWRGQSRVKQLLEDKDTAISSSHLVIDVDLKDYNDVRSCSCRFKPKQRCSDCQSEEINVDSSCDCEWKNLGSVCRSCWSFATSAMLVVDYILRNFWGFVDFYFFFSGKKGFHCWILDPETEDFTKKERKRFVSSFEPWQNLSRIRLCDEACPRSDTLSRSFDSMLELVFQGVIIAEGSIFFLPNVETWHSITEAFDLQAMDETLFDRFELHFNPRDMIDSLTLWETCKAFLDTNYPSNEALTIKRRLMYRYTFPRVDIPVTTKLWHAKKSIFSIHPETNRVSTPLLPHTAETIFNFRPSQTPMASNIQLITEHIESLQREISISGLLLKQISHCALLPHYEVPEIDEANTPSNEGLYTVFMSTYSWLVEIKAGESLILPWHESHLEHYAKCRQCVDYIFVDSRSTLQHWVVSNSWTQGIYSKTIELGLKLAWLIYLWKFCPQVEIETSTKDALKYYYQELKFVEVS